MKYRFTCKTLSVAVGMKGEDLGIIDGYYVTKFTYDGKVVLSMVPYDPVLNMARGFPATEHAREERDHQTLRSMGLDPSTITDVESA